jgi:hypothetical protein
MILTVREKSFLILLIMMFELYLISLKNYFCLIQSRFIIRSALSYLFMSVKGALIFTKLWPKLNKDFVEFKMQFLLYNFMNHVYLNKNSTYLHNKQTKPQF